MGKLQTVILWLLIWVVSSAAVGWFTGPKVGASFLAPRTLKDHRWKAQSAGLRHVATVADGVYVADGVLTIDEFASLSLHDVAACGELQIFLHPQSEKLELQVGFAKQQASIQLSPDQFSLENESWKPASGKGHYRLRQNKQGIYLLDGEQEYPLPRTRQSRRETRQQLSIAAGAGKIQIQQLHYSTDTGRSIIAHDFSTWQDTRFLQQVGAGMGALVGAGCFIICWTGKFGLGSIVLAVILLVAPFMVVQQPFIQWLGWIEKLYMTKTKPWELARMVLAASFLPFLLIVLGRSLLGMKNLPPQSKYFRAEILALFFCMCVVAYLSLEDFGTAWLLTVGFLLLPYWWIWSGKYQLWPWLLRDLPALGVLLYLGVGKGLIAVILLRFMAIAYSLRSLIAQHAQFAAIWILILLGMLPLSTEFFLRSTYLEQVWDFQTLSLEYNAEDRSEFIEVAWDGFCGKSQQSGEEIIVFTGGSSTGRNQFKIDPKYFFPATAHQALCAQEHWSTNLRTYNYGRSGLDTHSISRTLDELFAQVVPDILVLYVGVNDLLTREHEMSKKDREHAMDSWRSSLRGVQKYTARSRFLIGSSLLFRSLSRTKVTVPNVPLVDARDNFMILAKACQQKGAQLLLLTEYVNPRSLRSDGAMSEFYQYQRVQKEIAEQFQHVYFYDLWSGLTAYQQERLLMDTNHLSVVGHQRVGTLLRQPLVDILAAKKSSKP